MKTRTNGAAMASLRETRADKSTHSLIGRALPIMVDYKSGGWMCQPGQAIHLPGEILEEQGSINVTTSLRRRHPRKVGQKKEI